MGFTKNKAWSIVIALILIIVFNVIMFILPLEHGIMFWMGYSFETFSVVFLLSTALLLLNKSDINDKIYGQTIFRLPYYDEDIEKLCAYLNENGVKFEEVDSDDFC